MSLVPHGILYHCTSCWERFYLIAPFARSDQSTSKGLHHTTSPTVNSSIKSASLIIAHACTSPTIYGQTISRSADAKNEKKQKEMKKEIVSSFHKRSKQPTTPLLLPGASSPKPSPFFLLS